MSSSTLAAAPVHRPLRLLARVVAVVIAGALLALLAVAGWFYHAARKALPQLDGVVQVPGLSAKVAVTRDTHGVPHILAAGMDDLFFAQGYVTAQDRLWQMDVLRRYAAGELSEVMGARLLEHDRQQRILLIRSAAERAAAALSPRDRAYFEAYARGVNAFLDFHRNRLPIEFRVLRYLPKPWTPTDSLLVGVYMSQLLNHGPFLTKLSREKVLAKLGPELAADLYPNTSWHDRPPGSSPAASGAEPAGDDDDGDMEDPPVGRAALPAPAFVLDDAALFEPLLPGSNNWVVSGAHTVSGKPLLSNDMHLPHQIPNIWYEAHLELASPAAPPSTSAGPSPPPPFNVAGVTLPGVPFVIVGHNQRIAWGFTNLGPDVEDVFIETFNHNGEYQTPGGWKKPEVRREVIHIKDRPDLALDVLITRHGPIVTQLVPGETRKIALQWGIYDPAFTAVPFAEVDAAQNWEEFRRAFSRFGGPAQNVVYADVDGHIGYQATGRIPLRASGGVPGAFPGDGSLPVPGNDDAHEWIGAVPFDRLPSVFDPPSGIIATANGRITPDGYPYSLSTQWFPPYRTERIYRVLESGKKFAPADMLALQMDIHSEFDHFCADRLVYALDHIKAASPRARAAADLMRSWEGRVTAASPAPTLVAFARRNLYRLLLEPRLGADWEDYHWGMQPVALENILVRQPPRWLPGKFSSYNELLAAALEAAVSDPQAPRDLASWRWGKQFPVFLQHPLFGAIPVLGRWTGPGLKEQSGGRYTVKQAGRAFGSSQRLTVDFSDLDASTLNIVTGQSGQIFSPYYMDHWSAWYEGKTFPLPFTPAAVARARAHQLILAPKK